MKNEDPILDPYPDYHPYDRGGDEYPRDLYTATKAEYLTRARVMKRDRKKPGCPLMGGTMILLILAIVQMLFGGRRMMNKTGQNKKEKARTQTMLRGRRCRVHKGRYPARGPGRTAHGHR